MHDVQLSARLIQAVHAGGLVLSFDGEEVGEILGVVGQYRVDSKRRRLIRCLDEGLGGARALVRHQTDIAPLRGPIEGHEGIASPILVAHLRQVLDVNVHEAWLIGLEGHAGAGLGFRFFRQAGDAVLGQVQRRAQIEHQRFLPVIQPHAQPMRCMTPGGDRLAMLSFDDRVPRLSEVHRPPPMAASASRIGCRIADLAVAFLRKLDSIADPSPIVSKDPLGRYGPSVAGTYCEESNRLGSDDHSNIESM